MFLFSFSFFIHFRFASPEDVPNLAEAAASAFLATPNRHSHHPSSPHTSRTHHRSHSAPSNPIVVRPNPPAFAQAAVGIFIPPLPLHPLLSRNHYCTMTLSRLVCTQAKPDLYLVCHAPFLVFPGRTGFSKKVTKKSKEKRVREGERKKKRG